MRKQVFIAVSGLLSLTAMMSPAVALDPTKILASVPSMMPGPPSHAQAAPTATVKFAATASQQHLETGLKFLANNDLDHALIEFLKSAKDNPLNVRAFYEQAVVFNQKGYSKLAQSALQQALSIKPDYKDARILLASVYLQSGNVSQAAGEMMQSLGLAPAQKPNANAARSATSSPHNSETVPEPILVQTPHGRLLVARPLSPETAAINHLTKDEQHAGNGNLPTPKMTLVSHANSAQGNAAAAKDNETDEQLLDRVLGRKSDENSAPEQTPATPSADAGKIKPPALPAVAEQRGTQPESKVPPGEVTKTISVTNAQAQQLLKQITTANQQPVNMNWPNPLNWIKHSSPMPAANPSPPVQDDNPFEPYKATSRQQSAKPDPVKPAKLKPQRIVAPQPKKAEEQHANGMISFFDKFFGNHGASSPAPTPYKLPHSQQPPAIKSLLTKANQQPSTITGTPDDASDFAVNQTSTAPPSAQQESAAQPIPPAKVRKEKVTNRAMPKRQDNNSDVVAHGVERIHIEPSNNDSDNIFKRLFAWNLFPARDQDNQAIPDPETGRMVPQRRPVYQPPANNHAQRDMPMFIANASAQVAAMESPATPAPPCVTLPPVPPLSRLPAKPRSKFSTLCSNSPMQVVGGLNTLAMDALLQLLPPEMAVSVELALMPRPNVPVSTPTSPHMTSPQSISSATPLRGPLPQPIAPAAPPKLVSLPATPQPMQSASATQSIAPAAPKAIAQTAPPQVVTPATPLQTIVMAPQTIQPATAPLNIPQPPSPERAAGPTQREAMVQPAEQPIPRLFDEQLEAPNIGKSAPSNNKSASNSGFSVPQLVGQRLYVLKAATPKFAPVPAKQPIGAKAITPCSRADDIWTKRMKYLLAYGTSSLSPGEAFMFSEETGEGLLFLKDKTVIKRKIAEPQTHEDVAQLRRPDILNKQDDMFYSLTILGKLLTDPGKHPSTHTDTPALADTEESLDKNQTEFMNWLKSTFKF
jgi:tetratricopeptide (TPR) repeat protein